MPPAVRWRRSCCRATCSAAFRARSTRRASGVASRGVPAPASDEADDIALVAEWRTRGEQTCAAVYGDMYEKLRLNVRDLHPALDAWMVIDGYGKVLSRPGLDLPSAASCASSPPAPRWGRTASSTRISTAR